MNKILLSALAAFGISIAASAQTKGSVEVGVNVGYNYSTITTEEDTADSAGGFNVGTSMEYYFSDRWGIKAKLIYDQKGYDNAIYFPSTDPAVASYRTDVNLHYITIPVMANWHFGSKRNWYLNFGPYAGFLVSAKETQGGDDVKEYFNSSDFGLAIGIGVKIPVSDKMKVFFEYEGQGGFTEINKGDTFDVTNSRGSFNVGLNFLLK